MFNSKQALKELRYYQKFGGMDSAAKFNAEQSVKAALRGVTVHTMQNEYGSGYGDWYKLPANADDDLTTLLIECVIGEDYYHSQRNIYEQIQFSTEDIAGDIERGFLSAGRPVEPTIS